MNLCLAETPSRNPAHRRRAFTLLEVLLAVGIAGALLAVALFFYRQATTFRDGVLDEMARLGAARQLMSRLASELTCLAPEAGSLRGTASEIEFAFAAIRAAGESDAGLHQVRYALPEPAPDAEPDAAPPRLQRRETSLTPSEPADEATGEANLVTFGSLLSESEEPPPPAGQAPIPEVGFFQLRYWDGDEWQESWDATEPPLGIEVTLGFQPPEEDAWPEDYPHEVFRRLIALPVMGAPEVDTSGGSRRAGGETARSGSGAPPPDAGNEPPPPAPDSQSSPGRRGR